MVSLGQRWGKHFFKHGRRAPPALTWPSPDGQMLFSGTHKPTNGDRHVHNVVYSPDMKVLIGGKDGPERNFVPSQTGLFFHDVP
jgi:hypothetical protein